MVNKTNYSASFRCFFLVRPQNYCYRNALILGKRGDRNNDVGMLETLIDVGRPVFRPWPPVPCAMVQKPRTNFKSLNEISIEHPSTSLHC